MASVHCVFCGLNLASIPAGAVYCTCGNMLPRFAASGVASYSAPPAAAPRQIAAAAPGPPGLFERLGAAILDSMFFSAFGASVKEFAASNPWEDILGVNSAARILMSVLLGSFGWYIWNMCVVFLPTFILYETRPKKGTADISSRFISLLLIFIRFKISISRLHPLHSTAAGFAILVETRPRQVNIFSISASLTSRPMIPATR